VVRVGIAAVRKWIYNNHKKKISFTRNASIDYATCTNTIKFIVPDYSVHGFKTIQYTVHGGMPFINQIRLVLNDVALFGYGTSKMMWLFPVPALWIQQNDMALSGSGPGSNKMMCLFPVLVLAPTK
jgi:hypothetical protein